MFARHRILIRLLHPFSPEECRGLAKSIRRGEDPLSSAQTTGSLTQDLRRRLELFRRRTSGNRIPSLGTTSDFGREWGWTECPPVSRYKMSRGCSTAELLTSLHNLSPHCRRSSTLGTQQRCLKQYPAASHMRSWETIRLSSRSRSRSPLRPPPLNEEHSATSSAHASETRTSPWYSDKPYFTKPRKLSRHGRTTTLHLSNPSLGSKLPGFPSSLSLIIHRSCLKRLSSYNVRGKNPYTSGRYPLARLSAVLVALFIGRYGDLYVLLSRYVIITSQLAPLH